MLVRTRHAASLPEADAFNIQSKSIVDGRLLLNEPDAVTPMVLAALVPQPCMEVPVTLNVPDVAELEKSN